MKPHAHPRFLTFEGIDGAGKSTQLAHAAAWLRQRSHDVVITREPGGTRFGEQLRALVLDPAQPLSGTTEALVMFAARSHHLEHVIRPSLARGAWVLCDRFSDATLAYQHFGRGVPREPLEALCSWVHGELAPARTFLFEVPTVVAAARRSGRGAAPDRFERETQEFHERVAAGYLDLARQDPGRYRIISDHDLPNAISKSLEVGLAEAAAC
jgi:dTMP kinase